MKRCSHCKETKELGQFSKNKASKDGYNNQCKSCVNEYRKAYQKSNKEKIRERNKKYYRANSEQIKKSKKAYHRANSEQIKKSKKAYHKANADKIKEYYKEYCKANADKIKAYYKAYQNSPTGKETNKRYYLKLNLANSKISQRTLTAWSIQVRGKTPFCNWCSSEDNLEAHHILPKSRFPQYALDVENGLTLCNCCHILIHKQGGF